MQNGVFSTMDASSGLLTKALALLSVIGLTKLPNPPLMPLTMKNTATAMAMVFLT